jgi:D-alanyl-D-alanine endopeptidase (penicillin-binding protein 7)
MKKILAAIIFLSLLFSALPALAAGSSYNEIGIASAAVGAKSGTLVAGKNTNTVLPLASLTKLMTALVLLDLDINFKSKVTITKAEVVYTTPYVAQGDVTSKIDLKAGDKVTKDDLWHAMLIASSNEAAVALVDNSGLTRKQFIARMNAKAKALGLKYTKFSEPSGIDVANVGTPKEMALIAKKAYAIPAVRLASITPAYRFKELTTGRTVGIYSRNNSLLAMDPLGMKVGYLTEARDNCAVRLSKNGKDYIVVILHASTNAARNAEIARLMKK